MKITQKALLITSTLIVPLCSQNALANDLEEEIIVTAQMREEPLLHVPMSISVLNRESFELYGDNIQDIENAIPSIGFGRAGRRTRGELSIRGVGDFSRNIGVEPRVSVYIDSILVGRSSAYDQSLLGIERIEVLKGPQGALYGANSIAGAIKIITQAPDDDFSANTSGTYGNLEQKYQASVNIPISTSLKVNAFALESKENGFINNLHLDKYIGDTTTRSGRLRAQTDLEDHDLQFDFGLNFMNQKSNGSDSTALPGGSFGGYTSAPGEREVAHDADEYEERNLFGANFTTNWKLGSYKITQLIGYQKNKHEQKTDQDYSSLDIATNTLNEKLDQKSYELRVVSPEFDNFNFVSGIYHLSQSITTTSRADGGNLFVNPNTETTIPSSVGVHSNSMYSTANYRINDSVKVTMGVRVLSENRDVEYTSQDSTGLFLNVPPTLTDKHKQKHKVLPSAQISWLSSDHMVYASIAKGHKSAGWNVEALQSIEHFSYEEESALNYELGLKGQKDIWRYTYSLYQTKYKDFQVFQIVPISENRSMLTITNAAEVTSQGAEFDGTVDFNNLSFNIALSYNEAKFDTFKNADGQGTNYDGNRLQYAPHFSASLGLGYERHISSNINFKSNISYSHIGEYYSNPNNKENTYITDRDIVNISLDLLLYQSTELKFWVQNLFDQTNLRSSGTSFLGEPRGVYDSPRSYGFTLSYNF